MTVVDASVLVSALLPSDVNHQRSKGWLQRRLMNEERVMIPSLALAEVAGAISRRSGRSDLGRAALDQILSLPRLEVAEVNRRLGEHAARLAADHGLRGADAVYVALASHAHRELLTLDREMQDRLPATLVVSEPE